MEGSYLLEMARGIGFQIVRVAFADRAYDKDKHLISRKHPNALIDAPNLVAERVEQLVTKSEVRTVDGVNVPLKFDSIMLHGDSPRAPEVARPS
jgi:UPF0271 protein